MRALAFIVAAAFALANSSQEFDSSVEASSTSSASLPSAIKFVGYRSGKHEKLWIDNVQKYEDDVCNLKHLPNSTINGWIATVRFINALDEVNTIAYMRNTSYLDTLNKKGSALVSNDYVSFYDYTAEDPSGTSIAFSVPVESIIGLARDPRKCWNFRSEEFTQSKEFLLPLNGHMQNFMRSFEQKRRGKRGNARSGLVRTQARNFLFDAGATYYSDLGSQGTKWIVDYYGSKNVEMDNVVCWEKKPLMGDLIIKGVPDKLVPGFQYFNHPIEIDPKSMWNPLTYIKKVARRSDFVVFKLDIDHQVTEENILKQLAKDDEAISLIDEFYYEQHFSNRAMQIHGWWKLYKCSLSDYYKLVIPLREKGFRIHYWP